LLAQEIVAAMQWDDRMHEQFTTSRMMGSVLGTQGMMATYYRANKEESTKS